MELYNMIYQFKLICFNLSNDIIIGVVDQNFTWHKEN